MNSITKRILDEALKVIASTRYKMGTMSFLVAFIEEWAYHQTGMYPPANPLPEELRSEATRLSILLSNAMALEPTADILGYVMSQSNFDKRGTNYFPTPPDIGKLLCALAGIPPQDETSFYEPCCGSGINAILWMEQIISKNGTSGLSQVSIYLEDIDPIMVKCSMIQLVHYLQHKTTTPKKISIVAIDTITRKNMGVSYFLESCIDQERNNAA